MHHVFSVQPVIDTIIVLHEVNHMFRVFLIVDSIVVTHDLSNYVDTIVASEVFTVPHLIRVESIRTPRTARTVLGLY